MTRPDFESLIDHLLFGVSKGQHHGEDALILITTAGRVILAHDRDCCESVTLSEVTGVGPHPGSTIRVAEERATGGGDSEAPWGVHEESWTATFYALRTDGDDVDAQFQGSSNGYYSEGVDITIDPLSVEDVEGLPPDARVSLDRWLEAGGVLNVVSP